MASSDSAPRVRIVIGALGTEGDDGGSTVVARALRDAGHEVIYTGVHQSAEQIVETAIQEDADLIGLSVPSGAPQSHAERLVELLAVRDAADIGVHVFLPDVPTAEITGWVAREIA